GSPAPVLAAIAQGQQCLLVLDQLDAVSIASGRATQLFECLEEILQEARGFPNMRVLLACRSFDLDNDHRLRQLTDDEGIAQAVPIKELSASVVTQVVSGLGFDATNLTRRQTELFSIPLHLRLLAECGTK